MQNCNMTSQDLEISTKSGCNYLATKRISKTASINSVSKRQRAPRFIVWCFIVIMTLQQISETDARPQKRKIRNTNSAVDWNNPCGGIYDESKPSTKMDKSIALNFLRRATRSSIRNLEQYDKQAINISDILKWDKHEHNYKFIPKLSNNSSIALRRWYRNLQTYVAGFSYLHSVQYTYERNRNEVLISNELRLLLNEARTVLCEIESTINRTSINGKNSFSPVSKIEMEKRLKFVTKTHMDNNNLQMAYEVDLKYMKYFFMDFLRGMCKIIKKFKPNHTFNSNSSNQSANDSNSRSAEMSTSRSRLAGGRKHNKLANKTNRKNKSKKYQKINVSTA